MDAEAIEKGLWLDYCYCICHKFSIDTFIVYIANSSCMEKFPRVCNGIRSVVSFIRRPPNERVALHEKGVSADLRDLRLLVQS